MISPELNMSDYGDEDTADRLERLGLPLLLLNRALIEARGAVLEHTSLDAPSASGMAAYSRVSRCLGEYFRSQEHPTYSRVVDHNQILFVRIGLMMSSLSSLGGILRLEIGAQCHLRHALKVL